MTTKHSYVHYRCDLEKNDGELFLYVLLMDISMTFVDWMLVQFTLHEFNPF